MIRGCVILFVLCLLKTNGATLLVPSSYATIQLAVNAANAGDTVLVSAGTYDELVSTVRNGSSGSRIIIDGQGVATVKGVLLLHTYIHLQNFTISGVTNAFSRHIYLDKGASFCVISNNIIDPAFAPNVYGIQWNASGSPPFGSPVASNVLVVSNTIQHVGGYIMVINYGDFNTFVGNTLKDSPQSDCFNIFGRSNVFTGNLCSNFWLDTNFSNHADFVQTFGNNGYGSEFILIESNLVIGVTNGGVTEIALNQLSSVLIPEITDWRFRNNVFVNIGIHGSCSTPNVRYYNNTFIRCNWFNEGQVISISYRDYDGSSTFSGLPGTDYPNGCEIINNVFFQCGDLDGANTNSTGWYSFTTNLTNIVADYNFISKSNYTAVGTNPLHQRIGDAGGWDQFTWWEDHGINGGNPSFVSEALQNFHLQAGSLLIGAATNLNSLFTTDYDGVIRGSSWDIGAFESTLIPFTASDGGLKGIRLRP